MDQVQNIIEVETTPEQTIAPTLIKVISLFNYIDYN